MAEAEEEEAPFKAEYAKSGRAGCKLCKGAITKDSLRLAKMVQSPFFDGKQPNWYHYGCFFKTCQPRATSDVSGYPCLRPSDQDRLRSSIEGSAEATDGGGKGKGKAGRVTTRNDLCVEYAKSGRSSCKGCNSTIEKGEVRVAKMEAPDPTERAYGGQIPRWHHVSCFLERAVELEAEGVAAEELSGFSKLKKEDQKEFKGKLPGPGKKKSGKKRKAVEADSNVVKRSKVDEGKRSKVDEVKRSKVEEEKQQKLREQGEALWRVKDQLKAQLSLSQLREMLQANCQTIPSGESKLLSRCADGMLYGALQPCPECSGQLVAGNYRYHCTGNISSWTKCVYSTVEAERAAWIIPDDLREEAACLKKYKYSVAVRIFEDAPSPSASAEVAGPNTNVEAPLQGFSVFVIGRLGQSKAQITQKIQEMGGRVVGKISEGTTICLSREAELDKMSKKMREVEECDVPVVKEEFLEAAAGGGALLKIPPHTISSWGAPRHSLTAEEMTDCGVRGALKSAGSSVTTLTVKGSSAVDPESGLEDSHHVLEEKGAVFSAVLGLVDIKRGTNSYYKLQLLEGDSGKGYYLFRSWGRVGTSIGGSKLESYGGSKSAAKEGFTALFLDKTGNQWKDRGDTFVKKPNKFYPLDIDYGVDEGAESSAISLEGVRSKSTLHPAVQDLVCLIFDVESMKKTMLEFEIDMKKMPLGKLSSRQMRSAYAVLTELQKEVAGAARPAHILDASNRFYTLIPHDFGLKKPPLLGTEEVIKAKTQMVDSLLEIEVAYSLLQEEQKGDPIDSNYSKLKTDLQPLDKDRDEFAMLQEYVANTHGATHSSYSLEVLEVFSIARHGESKRYKPFSKMENRMLLWHGSRTTNYVGILSQGLRIAPPEAPVTGYMFGKGVYFADMVSKSANYCRTTPSEPVGLLLLCEVALGNMYELTRAQFISHLPPGKHSTKGVGHTAPDPAGQVLTEKGVIVPKGAGQPTSVTDTSLLYNEYIVYDVAQISMRYLLKCNFNYKW